MGRDEMPRSAGHLLKMTAPVRAILVVFRYFYVLLVSRQVLGGLRAATTDACNFTATLPLASGRRGEPRLFPGCEAVFGCDLSWLFPDIKRAG